MCAHQLYRSFIPFLTTADSCKTGQASLRAIMTVVVSQLSTRARRKLDGKLHNVVIASLGVELPFIS